MNQIFQVIHIKTIFSNERLILRKRTYWFVSSGFKTCSMCSDFYPIDKTFAADSLLTDFYYKSDFTYNPKRL
jgi:hypothetical protein